MRKFVFASVVIALGCGGGSTKNEGTGAVDPNSLDFCLQWANGVCRLAYLCTDATSQDAAFHARFGASQDTCWEGLEKLCTSNQSGSQAFGPSCGPGKVVNTGAAQTCTDNLDTQSCATWQAAPAGACDAVCGAASHTGGSGAGGAGNGGTGATGGTGSVATPAAYCVTSGNLTCDRGFECDPDGGTALFGNLAGCKEYVASSLCAATPCASSFDAALASSCIAATKAATCEQLLAARPAVCTSACVQ